MSRQPGTPCSLRLAHSADLDTLVRLVGAYHEFEQLDSSAASRRVAIAPLLENPPLGRIWLIDVDGRIAGYIALCFGYSIEFSGLDSFIDEFYLEPGYRGRGVGRRVLDQVAEEARGLGIKALHLEVAKTNERAARLYGQAGFVARSKYVLMTRCL